MRRQQLTTSCILNFEAAGACSTGLQNLLHFKSNDARECAAPGAVACRDCGKLTHEQFNNTLPSLATDCASVPGGKAKVEYCYAVNVPGDRKL